MKKETSIRIYGCTLIIAASVYLSAYVKDNEFHTYPEDNQAFYNGQILLPDHVINDTLIVINAKLLNDELCNCDIPDGSYSDLLGEGCVYKADYTDYQDYINVTAKK